MINYYVQYLTNLILELKAKNNGGDKKQVQLTQQKLDKAIKTANEVNKDNNKANKYPSNE